MAYEVKVVDWGDEAYKKYGEAHTIITFITDKVPSYGYDGGRLDINGWPDTIWVFSHQFSVEVKELVST
jgi:hypothetical protein